MSVREALALINQILDEVLAEQEGDFDADSRWAVAWWEMVHHLIRILEQGGEQEAAAMVRTLGGRAESARELCYRLYTVCERRKRAAEALAYNGLVQSWPEISRLAAARRTEQGGLFGDDAGNVGEEA